MRRVSSRPRLFSWDQFDAAVPESELDFDTSSQADSDYESCVSASFNYSGHAGSHASASTRLPIEVDAAGDLLQRQSLGDVSYLGLGQCRSSSFLSLKHFSAHASFDDDDYSDDGSEFRFGGGEKAACGSDAYRKDQRIGRDRNIPVPALEEPSLTSDLIANATKPLHINMNNALTSTFASRNKKRNVDGIKKSVSFSTLPSTLVQTTKNAIGSDLPEFDSLPQMPQDAQIHCLTFLQLDDLKKLSMTCKFFRNMLTPNGAQSDQIADMDMVIRNSVWWNLIRREWPDLHLDDGTASCSANDSSAVTLTPNNVQFIENNCGASQELGKTHTQGQVNYAALLLLSRRSPSTIDSKKFTSTTYPFRRNSIRQRSAHALALTTIQNTTTASTQRYTEIASAPPTKSTIFRKFRTEVHENDLKAESGSNANFGINMEVVQFMDRVGFGDRSITSNAPFPRPHVQSSFRMKMPAVMNTFGTYLYNMAHEKYPRTLEPFVSPFVTSGTVTSKPTISESSLTLPIEINLSPRMMAYFEVSILPNPESLATPQSNPSCVAVGLSTDTFHCSARMPGWDTSSYGYHGDDGGLFHSQGEMIRVYGPKFNVGDTVGCGVNYQNGGIFFTLNGDFLGYAWLNESIIAEGATDLYPTVGVDSKDFIGCNFGNERPFIFNFSGFIANGGNMPLK